MQSLASTAFVFIATCLPAIVQAQAAGNVKYAGPLDSLRPATIRIAQFDPVQEFVPVQNRNTVVGSIAERPGFEPLSQAVPDQPIGEPAAVRPPVLQPKNTMAFHQRYLTTPPSVGWDFGYQDGQAFGFDNSRLYNPLEGPQLNLMGAPTVPSNFGVQDECDAWSGFCNSKDLGYKYDCGGLKMNPGHLGIPWLRSKDNCDQTAPLKRRSCQQCSATQICEECSQHD